MPSCSHWVSEVQPDWNACPACGERLPRLSSNETVERYDPEDVRMVKRLLRNDFPPPSLNKLIPEADGFWGFCRARAYDI